MARGGRLLRVLATANASAFVARLMMRCTYASRMVAVRLVSEYLADGCRPLGFRVPWYLCLADGCRPLPALCFGVLFCSRRCTLTQSRLSAALSIPQMKLPAVVALCNVPLTQSHRRRAARRRRRRLDGGGGGGGGRSLKRHLPAKKTLFCINFA